MDNEAVKCVSKSKLSYQLKQLYDAYNFRMTSIVEGIFRDESCLSFLWGLLRRVKINFAPEFIRFFLEELFLTTPTSKSLIT